VSIGERFSSTRIARSGCIDRRKFASLLRDVGPDALTDLAFGAPVAITGCTNEFAMCHCDCARRADYGDLVNQIVTCCVLSDGCACSDSPSWQDKLPVARTGTSRCVIRDRFDGNSTSCFPG